MPYLQPRVMSPFLILPKGFELMASQMQFNPETFQALDGKLTAIAEVIAGTFIPEQVQFNGQQQGPQTATEATIDATREEEIRQGILNRWWNQFTHLIGQIQRRIYSPLNLKSAIEYREARDNAALEGLKLVNQETMDLLLEVDLILFFLFSLPLGGVFSIEPICQGIYHRNLRTKNTTNFEYCEYFE